jgi:catechol 2,3-dioxygenase-like lactoylglutathione lyase family enzyme
MTAPSLIRAVAPVTDIARGVEFYRSVLDVDSEEVGPGRHYLHCQGAILVCLDPDLEGHDHMPRGPNGGHLYFAVDDLDGTFDRARGAGCLWLDEAPQTRSWGERSFYARDPFDNPLCFIQRGTNYTARAS